MTYDESITAISENWSVMSAGEKLEALQAIEDRMAFESDRFACPVEGRELFTGEHSVTLGLFDPGSGRIYINSTQLEAGSRYGGDPQMLVSVCLHEGRHAYQHQAVNGAVFHDDPKELQSWKDNFDNYISFRENPRAYYDQPLERDARAFAEARGEILIEEQKQLRQQSIPRGIGM